jgi:cytochrome P450
MASIATTDADPAVPEELVSVILDPTAYADDRIYDAYAWLRENNPVARVSHPDFDPFWILTRYDDVRKVGLDNATFHSGDMSYNLNEKRSVDHAKLINGGDPNLIRSLVAMDIPEHNVYRKLTQTWFMGTNLKKREDEIRELARNAVEAFVAKGERVDFVADLATDYPLRVIMNILGVPEADWPLMLRLTQQNFGTKDPDLSGEPEALKAEQYADFMHNMVTNFTTFFNKLSEERRREPKEDLTSLIANARIDGQQIPVDAEMGYYITIVTGGHDTTSSSASVAMWELARRPELLAKVKADPALIANLVDEGVRFATPVKHFMRSAAIDTVVGGREIAKGDWLMLCYGSANRDEAVFPNPNSFEVDRPLNKHIGFGYGPHVCLGQHLAKMEMKILFEELLPRIKSVSLDGVPARSVDWFVNGPKTVPVKVEFE